MAQNTEKEIPHLQKKAPKTAVPESEPGNIGNDRDETTDNPKKRVSVCGKNEKNGASDDKSAQEDALAAELADPTSYELLDEVPGEGNDKTAVRESGLYKVQKSFISFEIQHHRGIQFSDGGIVVPGRASLTLFSFLEVFAIAGGFVAGIIHFSICQHNYLLPAVVIPTLMFAQVILYDSACRALRFALNIIETIGTLIFMALINWAFIDLIVHPPEPSHGSFMLILSLLSYDIMPILMVAHLCYFGRGTRNIEIRRNSRFQKAAEGENMPTLKIESQKQSNNAENSSNNVSDSPVTGKSSNHSSEGEKND